MRMKRIERSIHLECGGRIVCISVVDLPEVFLGLGLLDLLLMIKGINSFKQPFFNFHFIIVKSGVRLRCLGVGGKYQDIF